MDFTFQSELFQTVETAKGAWVFVALPSDQADEILELETRQSGFGSVRVAVHLGDSDWQTSLFPSKELGTYVLPIKRSIRTAERISAGDTVRVTIHVES